MSPARTSKSRTIEGKVLLIPDLIESKKFPIGRGLEQSWLNNGVWERRLSGQRWWIGDKEGDRNVPASEKLRKEKRGVRKE